MNDQTDQAPVDPTVTEPKMTPCAQPAATASENTCRSATGPCWPPYALVSVFVRGLRVIATAIGALTRNNSLAALLVAIILLLFGWAMGGWSLIIMAVVTTLIGMIATPR